MKAISVSKSSEISLVELDKPKVGAGEIRIKTKGCGICGTDLLKINLNLLECPTVLGHELVGEVEAMGSDVQGFQLGDLIVTAHHIPCFNCHFCKNDSPSMCQHFKRTNFLPGGFAEYLTISKEHVQHTTFKIPKNIPWEEAIFTEPLACCVRNINRLKLLHGNKALVIGLGSIGLMMGSLLKRKGIEVLGLDLDENRCQLAKSYGFDWTHSKYDDELESEIKNRTEAGVDVVVYTAGPSTLLQKGISWVRPGGTLNLFSHLTGESSEINTSDLYHKELQIVTTYSADPKSLRESFSILCEGKIQLRRMLSKPYHLNHFSDAIKAANSRQVLKAWVKFD